MQTAPAQPGDSAGDIDTPALVVDLDAFERNLDLMANAVRGAAVALRPHGKAHKCPDIAFAQIQRGAVGICCQKVGEAEAFVAAGVRDVLVTNEIVGAAKLARLAAHGEESHGRRARRRCGRGPRDRRRRDRRRRDRSRYWSRSMSARTAAASRRVRRRQPFALAIARTPGLSFGGIHAYHGGAQHLREPEARRAAIANAVALVREAKAAIEAAGLACAKVTGAGTGTWQHERDSGVYTELQPGSYVFMDVDYQKNALAPDQHHFEQSLFVLATVMSAPAGDRAVVDAGLKSLASIRVCRRSMARAD